MPALYCTRQYSIQFSCFILFVCLKSRYHEAGRLSDQQMALLQYQRENLHYLSEEVRITWNILISTFHFWTLSLCCFLLSLLFRTSNPELNTLSSSLSCTFTRGNFWLLYFWGTDSAFAGVIEQIWRVQR